MGKSITDEAVKNLVTLTKSEFNKASQGITITLSTTWTYDSTNKYYTQSVLVTGIKATDKPVLGIDDSVDNAEEANSEWSKVFHAETYDGGIKFYAKSATTKNLTVLVKPDLSKVTINNVSSEEFAKQVIVNAIYPVGSIYMSVNDVNPTNLFGGTWEKIKDRFLLASGDSYKLGATGGEAEHSLTQKEIPNYLIGFLPVAVPGNHTTWNNGGIVGTGKQIGSQKSVFVEGGTFNPQYGYNISTYGGDSSHNNMPPYLAINIWKRTA